MSRAELEAVCYGLGYEPEEDDTDADLWSIINQHAKGRIVLLTDN